jgi:leader peptidase (prepilin peptidase) / N-methyltransferase
MDKLIVFIFGSIIGSFLNVCVYRLPKGKSIVTPASHCPKCAKIIQWYDNIPLISYIILRGHCRSCKAAISFRYFIIELLTALVLTALFTVFGLSAKFFAYSIMSCGLIVATFVDFETSEIPDEVSMGGLIVGLILAAAMPSVFGAASRGHALLASVLGAAAGGAIIYITGFLGELIFKKEAMGGGDVKLMAMIGSFLGWKLALFVFFVAPLFGSIVGIILKIKSGRETIPYGPYLSLAALVAVFFGERIIRLLFGGLI